MKLLVWIRNIAVVLFVALLIVTVFFGGPSDSTAVSAPARPTASFSVHPSGLDVTVDASASSAADGHSLTRYEWDWNFEPNSASFDVESTTESPTPDPHPYAASGTYIVGLRVVQNNGLVSEVAWQAVSVDGVGLAAATEPAPAPAAPCATTWTMEAPLPDGNVMPQVDEILNAQTDADASAAMDVWADRVRPHAATLASASKIFLSKEVDAATLTDADGCATLVAAQLDQELRLTIHAGAPKPEEAPADGTNTGLVDGAIMASTGPGIDGDRRAVKITLPDGTVVWVMGRCGNPVFRGIVLVATSPKAPAPVPPPAPETPTPGTTPGTPPPGTTTPPEVCEWPTPYGNPPYCKDSPDNNVLRNTEVPAGVKGNGSNPPGQTAGAASPVTDSPTGCRGSCDNPATASAPAANPAMTQSVVSDPPQVQSPTTANATIPSNAGVSGNSGGTCEVDAMGIPINGCS